MESKSNYIDSKCLCSEKKIFQKSRFAVSVTLCEKLRCGRLHPDIYFFNNMCLWSIKSDFLKGQVLKSYRTFVIQKSSFLPPPSPPAKTGLNQKVTLIIAKEMFKVFIIFLLISISLSFIIFFQMNAKFICHWNISSIPMHNFIQLSYLQTYIIIDNFDVIFLSEIYLDSNILPGIDNLQVPG